MIIEASEKRKRMNEKLLSLGVGSRFTNVNQYSTLKNKKAPSLLKIDEIGTNNYSSGKKHDETYVNVSRLRGYLPNEPK